MLDKTNAPIPGVTITVLNHPEFGQAQTRVDGLFDLAVNGGTPTLNYARAGFLPRNGRLTRRGRTMPSRRTSCLYRMTAPATPSI